MEENQNTEVDLLDIIYDINIVINLLETATDVKFKKEREYDSEYVAGGQITENQLVDLGFRFHEYSSYMKCPIYKLGNNIEAIFDETILHVYDLRG